MKQLVWAILVLGVLAGLLYHTISQGWQPGKLEKEDFDIAIATQMVGQGDKLIFDLTRKEEVSREECETFLKEMDCIYNGYDKDMWLNDFF